jgi:hypothetical protein
MRTLILHFFVLLTLAGQTFAQPYCPAGHTLNTPNSRYTVQTDSSQVKDTKTGLIWQRCSLGQTWSGSTCTGNAGAWTWSGALTAARMENSISAYSWRVPNAKELASLAELACNNPATNIEMFPVTPMGGHWSSSTFADNRAYAWFFKFDYGSNGIGGKGYTGYVRLVRSSQ